MELFQASRVVLARFLQEVIAGAHVVTILRRPIAAIDDAVVGACAQGSMGLSACIPSLQYVGPALQPSLMPSVMAQAPAWRLFLHLSMLSMSPYGVINVLAGAFAVHIVSWLVMPPPPPPRAPASGALPRHLHGMGHVHGHHDGCQAALRTTQGHMPDLVPGPRCLAQRLAEAMRRALVGAGAIRVHHTPARQ